MPRSVADPVLSNEIDVAGTVNLLVAARDAGVRPVVFAASSSAIVTPPSSRSRSRCLQPRNPPYAAQKLMGNTYLRIFHKIYGLKTVSLRYFNVSPRQTRRQRTPPSSPGSSPRCFEDPPTVYGDGLQTRDFTYIDNVIQANLAACLAPKTRAARSSTSPAGESALLDILEIVYGLAGKRVPRTSSRAAWGTCATRWPTSPSPGPHRIRPEGSLLRGTREDVRLAPGPPTPKPGRSQNSLNKDTLHPLPLPHGLIYPPSIRSDW